jgi:toxin-antitoxin system PIN domain toxin
MILVDVGVWLAATWGRHVHHRVAKRWFDEQSDDLLLCRVTQMSLLRLISNPAIMDIDVVTRDEAWRVIDQIWSDSRVLWAEEPDNLDSVFRAISARRDNSHKLWTDDYLAAFAQASGAVLATFDTKLKDRYPSVQIDQLTA